jgi:PAS domain S-box-containing protein
MNSNSISHPQLPDNPTEQEQYLHLINLMPEKVTKADGQGSVFYFNQSWENFTGVDKEELVAGGWEKWIHPDDVEEIVTAWSDAIKNENKFEMELRLLDSRGEYYWHISRARPIYDKNGNLVQWLGITTETQNQKEQNEQLEKLVKRRTKMLNKTIKELEAINLELRETKEKLESGYARSLIEASIDPLVTINTEGKITDMNEALSVITGKSREFLLNSDFENYFTEPEKAREIYQEVFKKGFIKDFPLILMDGELIDVLFNGAIYKDPYGKVLGAVVVATVMTEQKRIQNELLVAKEIAESERRSAEEASKKAEAAVKAKEQFLSNMSHEIRTPLNAIIGFTGLLMKTELSENQKKFMSAIRTSGNTLLLLINDILDLAKVNAGQMKFDDSPFHLAKSMDDVALLFEEKLLTKNLEFELKFDPKIPEVLMGDSLRLNQVITNLVGNAIKFTEKGKIQLSLKLVKQDKSTACIEIAVKDTGIGISEDRVKTFLKVFNRHQMTLPNFMEAQVWD